VRSVRPRERFRFAASLVVALLAVFVFSGCEKLDRNMYDNPAFRPQEEPVRLPPEGSVPTKGLEHTPKPGTPEAAALKNPEKVTDFSLLTGKELFGIYCTPCHGESGKGDGPVAKKFVPTPADISATGHGSRHPEGELFAVVTHGKNGMPPFRSDLTAKERWLVVTWLKTLK
jgi:mono/diheme cytochrome c family protein